MGYTPDLTIAHGKSVEVKKYFDGHPLIRIPRHLDPTKEHTLSIETTHGKAKISFNTSHYLVVTDTDDGKTKLIRTTLKEKDKIEKDWLDIKTSAKTTLYNLVSKDSVYLHLISVNQNHELDEDTSQLYRVTIDSYHLAEPHLPGKLSSTEFTLRNLPNEASIDERGHMLLLEHSTVIAFDASDPTNITETFRIDLAPNTSGKTAYVDTLFLDNNTKIAVLETHANRIDIIDVSNTIGKVIDSVSMLPEKSIPLSVDLEPDPFDKSKFWVLQAPNFRLTGSTISATYKKLLLRKDIPEHKKSIAKLQQYQLTDQKLSKGKTIKTPDNYVSYFATTGLDNRLYITATRMDFFTLKLEKLSVKNALKKVKEILWDSVSIGKIFAIDTKSGNTEVVSKGVGIYYHLVDIQGLGHAFSLLKLGPSFSFPYMSPTWGIGIKRNGTYAKRKMNKRAIFPPYNVGKIDFQY